MSSPEPFTPSRSPLFLSLPAFSRASAASSAVTGFTIRNGGTGKPPFDTLNLGLHNGDSPETVLGNRHRLANETGFPLENWVAGEQVHGGEVAEITSAHKKSGALSQDTALKQTDGLFTQEKGILLASFYADCVPLYFFDPVSETIGLAHAGWKGTAQNIAGNMLEAFEQAGAERKNIHAAIGPSISGGCYEVDSRVKDRLDSLPVSDLSQAAVSCGSGRYRLDLKEVNRQLILSAGVGENRIYVSSLCTYTEDSLFFSYRRDQGRTGRMMSFAGMREKE
ncbi:peptidoglycan editing factor PgeF [Alteribacter natronophilus]|uniref:peptidoglycan editing factor PgeF n=1 Tax=Alteribacter natronophilus TaxID=2583810 RepID=UPI00110F013F|nr:peptidoglycan editing factor PgeF [Alteribacter natronophilus]TMW73137.1 peptidoglycan editing factor PgeF [Alteribacter natronophilus]